MKLTYEEYLKNEEKLIAASKSPNKVAQRFFELHAMDESERNRIDQNEYETLRKFFRARWRAKAADDQARKLIGKIESRNRKTDAHSKILLGVAAIHLGRSNPELREALFDLASHAPAANTEYLAALLQKTDNA